VLISEINDLLGTNIDDEDIDTIGGWVLTENYDAKLGDTLEFDDYIVKIIEMEDHHIHYLEIKKKPENLVLFEKQPDEVKTDNSIIPQQLTSSSFD